MPPKVPYTTLVDELLNGATVALKRRALARLLTLVESEREGSSEALAALYPHTGKSWIIGVTGAPGTGKSSLVNALAKAYRKQGQTVAILAVDPTSPFTGGAILGDRIRMGDLSGDMGAFIRSMATRGSLGGLARAARDAIRVMDAAGFDIILVETVGAGQSEVDIVRTAHTTLVVEAPGLGDDVQAIKAGILEIADVLVVNKADRDGAGNTFRALKTMLELGHPASRTAVVNHHGTAMHVEPTASAAPPENASSSMWIPPIVRTVATVEPFADESGIPALLDAIARHRQYIQGSSERELLEKQRVRIELHERLQRELMLRLLRDVPPETFEAVIEQVIQRELDPQAAVKTILDSQRQVG